MPAAVDYKSLFKSEIARYLSINPESIFLFWKGRVALYAILKALGVGKGDEVILPAFTCVVVPNVIIYSGARPVYVDINPLTYNIDESLIEEKITKKTRVILAQNTFGLSSDLDKIIEIGRKYNISVVEDCAQGFGGRYKERLSGTITESAFFSLQWQKSFTTGIGGIAITRNPEISEKLRAIESSIRPNSNFEEKMLEFLLCINSRILTSKNYWAILQGYRTLSKLNFILGSSQRQEFQKPKMPKKFLTGFSNVQAKKGIEELKEIGQNIKHRKYLAQIYKIFLEGLAIKPPFEPAYAGHLYLKFPLLIKNRERLFREAKTSKIEIGDWFLSPLHPVTKNLGLWNYRWGENPQGEKISKVIVNLPTHKRITESYVSDIGIFLRRNRENIYNSWEEIK